MASNKKDLKAFVRYDGTGRLISGSLILQRNKPKVGNWKQIGAYECCDPSCLPPVYGEDFIIPEIINAEGGVIIVILTNPFTGVILQVGAVECVSEPGRILTLKVETLPAGSNPYLYFVPNSILEQTCGLAFRRVCIDNVSGWSLWD